MLSYIERGTDIRAPNRAGKTPLHLACENGELECAKILLKAGADPGARDRSGDLPLHAAAKSGYDQCCLALANAGADLEARNRQGLTALLCACQFDCPKTAKALLQAGADPRAKATLSEWTAMHAAAALGLSDLCRELAERGADPGLCARYPDETVSGKERPGPPMVPAQLARSRGHGELADWLAARSLAISEAALIHEASAGPEPGKTNANAAPRPGL